MGNQITVDSEPNFASKFNISKVRSGSELVGKLTKPGFYVCVNNFRSNPDKTGIINDESVKLYFAEKRNTDDNNTEGSTLKWSYVEEIHYQTRSARVSSFLGLFKRTKYSYKQELQTKFREISWIDAGAYIYCDGLTKKEHYSKELRTFGRNILYKRLNPSEYFGCLDKDQRERTEEIINAGNRDYYITKWVPAHYSAQTNQYRWVKPDFTKRESKKLLLKYKQPMEWSQIYLKPHHRLAPFQQCHYCLDTYPKVHVHFGKFMFTDANGVKAIFKVEQFNEIFNTDKLYSCPLDMEAATMENFIKNGFYIPDDIGNKNKTVSTVAESHARTPKGRQRHRNMLSKASDIHVEFFF